MIPLSISYETLILIIVEASLEPGRNFLYG